MPAAGDDNFPTYWNNYISNFSTCMDFFYNRDAGNKGKKRKWADTAPEKNEFPEKFPLCRNEPLKIPKKHGEQELLFSEKKTHPAKAGWGGGTNLLVRSIISFNQ